MSAASAMSLRLRPARRWLSRAHDSGVASASGSNEVNASTQDVTVTITGTNDAPLISVQTGNSASAPLSETNTTLTSSGTLTIRDVDLSNTVAVAIQSVTASGITTGLGSSNTQLLAMLSLTPAATTNILTNTEVVDQLAWAFNSGSEAFNHLAAGEVLTLTYAIRATDSASATADSTITVTITGTNDTPSISAKREIQQTLNLALTTSNHIYSFGSPENGTSEYGVAVQAPAGGFANAAAMAAAFQAHPNYNNLPYTISVNSAGTQLVLTFKADGNYGQRWFERWGDAGIGMTTLQDGQKGSASLSETNTTLTTSGSLTVTDLDTTDTVSAVISSVALTGSFMSSGAALPAPLGSSSDGYAALKSMLALSATGGISALAANSTAGTSFDWTFTSGSSGDAAFDFLRKGETLTLTYTLTLTDNSGASGSDSAAATTTTVAVTITGTNDTPDITVVDVTGAVTEDSSTTASGSPASQVDTITLSGTYEVGDSVTATVNGVDVAYTVLTADVTAGNATATRAAVAAKLAAAINANTNLTDFITASTSGSVLTITSDTAGLPFSLTATAANKTGGSDNTQAAAAAALLVQLASLLAGALGLLALPVSAAVTGALSGPHDRYQARVVWLPALVLLLAVARDRRALQPVTESGT